MTIGMNNKTAYIYEGENYLMTGEFVSLHTLKSWFLILKSQKENEDQRTKKWLLKDELVALLLSAWMHLRKIEKRGVSNRSVKNMKSLLICRS